MYFLSTDETAKLKTKLPEEGGDKKTLQKIGKTAKISADATIAIEKLNETTLKRMQTLLHDIEVGKHKDPVSMFVRNPKMMENPIKGAFTKALDRVMVNPKLTRNLQGMQDFKNLKVGMKTELEDLKYTPEQIENLLSDLDEFDTSGLEKFDKLREIESRPMSQAAFEGGLNELYDEHAQLFPKDVDFDFDTTRDVPLSQGVLNVPDPAARGMIPRPVMTDRIVENRIVPGQPSVGEKARRIAAGQRVNQSLDAISGGPDDFINLKEPLTAPLTAPVSTVGDLTKPILGRAPKISASSLEPVEEVLQDLSTQAKVGNVGQENLGLIGGTIDKAGKVLAKQQVTNILEGAGASNVSDVVKTIGATEKIAGTASSAVGVVGQVQGAKRIGDALSDGFQAEDAGEVIKGAVSLAQPFLIASGPAGWAVLGASVLHDLYESFS